MPLPSGLASDLRERRQKAFSIPVTNLYHQPVRIEGELAKGLLLLRLLDGRRNRFALSQDLAAGITNNPAFSSESARPIAEQLDHQLAQLARLGLLMDRRTAKPTCILKQ